MCVQLCGVVWRVLHVFLLTVLALHSYPMLAHYVKAVPRLSVDWLSWYPAKIVLESLTQFFTTFGTSGSHCLATTLDFDKNKVGPTRILLETLAWFYTIWHEQVKSFGHNLGFVPALWKALTKAVCPLALLNWAGIPPEYSLGPSHSFIHIWFWWVTSFGHHLGLWQNEAALSQLLKLLHRATNPLE